MPSVAEVAQAAGVSPAAVRARLAEGALEGRQELRGNRQVWVIEQDAAAAYVASHLGTAGGRSEPGGSGAGSAVPEQGVAPARPPSWLTADPAALGLEAALAENERLRAALGALSRAHQALVELVGVAFVERPAPRG